MQKNSPINNIIKNKDKLKLIQKAILTGIGVAASKDSIKKAAKGIYNDVQKIVQNLLKELEESGEIKTNQTKKIIKELQKKSEVEKDRIYKKLQKEGKTLLKSAKEIILTPISVLKDATKSLDTLNKTKKTKGNKRTSKSQKKKRN